MFKKILITIAFIITVNIVNAQNKWEAGFLASYDYSVSDAVSDANPHSIKDNSGFELGVQAFRKITKHVYFNTGLHIVRKRYSVGGVAQLGYPSTGSIRFLLTDLNIPVYLNIRIPVAPRLSIASTIGVTFGWDLKNTWIMTRADGGVNEFTRRRTWETLEKWAPSFGIGVLYKINDQFSLMGMPHIMFDLDNSYISYDLRAILIYNFK